MAGGLIEGIQKVYSGPNVLKKHLILLAICLIMGVIFAIVAMNTPEKASEAQIYAYLFLKAPLLGIIILICGTAIGLYNIVFSHNAIKLQIWTDTEKDPARIKALAILPDWNSNLLQPLVELIIFCVVWSIVIGLTVVILGALTIIPLIGIIPGIIMIIYISVASWILPLLVAMFSQSYSAKGLLSPFLIFSAFGRTFIPMLILYLKGIVYSIVVTIIIWAVVGLSMMVLAPLGKIGLLVTITLFVYIMYVAQLGFTYAVACIYHEKYVLECD